MCLTPHIQRDHSYVFKEGLDTADYEGMNMTSSLMVPLPGNTGESMPTSGRK